MLMLLEGEDKFCEKCGNELISNLKFVKYSKKLGKKLYTNHLRCPNKRWWNFHTSGILYRIADGVWGRVLNYYD